jgi:hypothetical protein
VPPDATVVLYAVFTIPEASGVADIISGVTTVTVTLVLAVCTGVSLSAAWMLKI